MPPAVGLAGLDQRLLRGEGAKEDSLVTVKRGKRVNTVNLGLSEPIWQSVSSDNPESVTTFRKIIGKSMK